PEPEPEETEEQAPMPSVVQPDAASGSILQQPGESQDLPDAESDAGGPVDIPRGELLPGTPIQDEPSGDSSILPAPIVAPEPEKKKSLIFEETTDKP
ncbi:MAG: hypothetical protein HOK06_08605, partial [Rhodospirillaceae bacterium]|nr:hypothetical protein [Rhodospirillaceae bacterium]